MLLCCNVGSIRSRVFGATLGSKRISQTQSEAYFNKLTCSILRNKYNLLCNNMLHGLQVEKQRREVFNLSFIGSNGLRIITKDHVWIYIRIL